jgi:hypothetical protein
MRAGGLFRAAVLLAALTAPGLACIGHAADLAAHAAPEQYRTLAAPAPIARPAPKEYSILVFGGRLSSTDIYSTALLNLFRDSNTQQYDNFIVGAAFQRDIWRWRGFVVGAELGLADRFGKYKECCDTIVKSSGLVHSGELWGGIVLRHEGVLLFDAVRIGAGLVGGLSAVTNAVGREREREITQGGNATLLFYLGAEFTLATPSLPDLELVVRLHHRSGASGILGGMAEGYNASVYGVRWRF